MRGSRDLVSTIALTENNNDDDDNDENDNYLT